jgi:predicted enzyme related to lactoylglutathione lyase
MTTGAELQPREIPEWPVLGFVTLDCADPERLGEFWAAIMEVEIEGRWGEYVMLAPQPRRGVRLGLQKVPEPKQGKNRMHMDFMVRDLDVAKQKVEDLGGSPVEEHDHGDYHWWVMADPEGNEFCIIAGS